MTTPRDVPKHRMGTKPDQKKNIAYQIGDLIHDWRAKRAQDRGTEPVIVASAGYGTPEWVRIIGRALYKTDFFEELISKEANNAAEPVRGWRSFTSIAISNAVVTVTIGDKTFDVVADEGGVIDVKIDVELTPGIHTITMETTGSAVTSTKVYIIPPEQKYGVISDVDDTVMITALPRPLLAAWNSFVLDEHARIPTPGMAVLLDRIHQSNPRGPVMYLSTGAWNITPTLRRFLSRNGYPDGVFLLTDWGPTPNRWFRSGSAHKVNSLKRLAAEFPDMKWILIGDDGQHDPAIYSGFAQRYPQNVAAILIRNLTVSESALSLGRMPSEPFASKVRGKVPWIEANDGMSLYQRLLELDLVNQVN